MIGHVLGDSSYVITAIDGPSGFIFHMKNSMQDDGFWFEGSVGYHFLVVGAYERLAEATRRRGRDLFTETVPMTSGVGTKSFESMFIAPIELAMPDLAFPMLNDAGGETLASQAEMYEVAYVRYPGEQAFGFTLCQIIAAMGGARNSINALLFGADSLPSWCATTGPTIAGGVGSIFMPNTGAAIVRTSSKDYLLVDAGPHGGWHGHYDKFSMIFFSHDQLLMFDRGTVPYRLPQHAEFFKRTLSHNAVMIDGLCQNEANGTLVKLGTLAPESQLISVTSSPLTADATARRTIWTLRPPAGESGFAAEYPLVVDIVEGVQNATSGHFYDTIYHSDGKLTIDGGPLPSFAGSLGPDISWTYLSNVAATNTTAPWTAVWTTTDDYQQHFEEAGMWNNLIIDGTRYIDGTHSGRWQNLLTTTSVDTTKIPTDWSTVAKITCWIYSEVADNATITAVANSPNASTSGMDYFSLGFKVDWTGWRCFNWTAASWRRVRSPIGWNYITQLLFSSTWAGPALSTTKLWIDAMSFFDASGSLLVAAPSGLRISSPATEARKMLITADSPSIPTTIHHPVVIERKWTTTPTVHIISPLSSRNFVTSFTVRWLGFLFPPGF